MTTEASEPTVRNPSPPKRLRVGAQVTPHGVRYRVWARNHDRMEVEISTPEPRRIGLQAEGGGFFTGLDPAGRAGDRYWFVLPDGNRVPDVASRFQPDGVFEASSVVDSARYRWRHPEWRRPAPRGRVIIEVHVGTFTRGGTFAEAIRHLDHLAEAGINTIELMPVADFAGRWNWGYDGVMLYAPARCYGAPDDLRALVDEAHGRGLAVILDVVYNHLGPAGSHLSRFSEAYYHPEKESPWGRSLNFDGAHSRPVRDFFVQNALYWLEEFRFDGLRFDATHAVHDDSPRPLFAEIADVIRPLGALTIAEDERNEMAVISRRHPGDWGLDAVWADDFHHSVRVAVTGQQDSYFAAFKGTAAELADILNHGWLYRGQYSPVANQPRGTPCDGARSEQLIVCISNHDQIGNRPFGDRLYHPATNENKDKNQSQDKDKGKDGEEAYRALSVLLCLQPFTPQLFMGQEWGASTPFLYFTDHSMDLGAKIIEGRRREFAHAYANADPASIPNPQAEETFRSSQLKWEEIADPRHRSLLALYRACLRLRASEEVFANPARGVWVAGVAGEVTVLSWRIPTGGRWLLAVAPKGPVIFDGAAEIAAPEAGRRWETVLYSNDPGFGGGEPAPEFPRGEKFTHAKPFAWLLREIF